ncbi:MAG: hypothetical protein SFX19_04555 [Alphaproteobacteria bacterium]|nr:hypothetical protein [Alphaproteobacteria bacterium]
MPGTGLVTAARECDVYAGDCDPQYGTPRTIGSAGGIGCTLTSVTPNIYNITYQTAYCNLNIKTSF